MSEQNPQPASEAVSEAVESAAPSEPAKGSKWGMVRYLALRTLLLIGCTLVLELITHNLIISLLLGILISSAISLFVLDRVRDDASVEAYNAFGGVRRRMQARRDEEDAAAEAIRAQQAAAPGGEPPATDDFVD